MHNASQVLGRLHHNSYT